MRPMIWRFLKDESGATAIEYGLIAALISIAMIGGVTKFSDQLNALWGDNDSELRKALK
ncbi:Flp family type IVb pilin [Aminobacter sp. AP02]|uniref:Flp family type IVb pilin n=1 Tax=Aminobacter sp. AP02 TaxID=2135737 RepID=UPI000D6C0ADA|nr:Flp family type IVb pilin [Aminobacter sp. AP02]PWK63290.1 pilus assembly protein Flp/PilA [Aminobacter sp. AP02]